MADQQTPSPLASRGWTPGADEPSHRLVLLDGRELAGGRLRVFLGRTSRFGARYFALLLETAAGLSAEALLTGLHGSGPLPSYNWIEVAETNERLTLGGELRVEVGADAMERLFGLLFDLLPAGGHLMVEYDSPKRAETARGLAQGVPAVATPLGEFLFRLGFGARFKDWQIAEGGSEGPRKLQAYKPLSDEYAARWRREAARDVEAFLAQAEPASELLQAARERAARLLPALGV